MGQDRNKTGVNFEKKICQLNGWTKKSKSPRICWVGTGGSNWIKMTQVNLDPTKFIPNLNKSKFEKYDAIDANGYKIEIKKYSSQEVKSWKMYAEPIFKISEDKTVETVTNIFGYGDYDTSVKKYNEFVEAVEQNVGQEILDSITKSNIGIQIEDRFIYQNELEYRWKIKKGWKGYNRLSIEFRLKPTEEID